MKKAFFVAGFAAIVIGASAQSKKKIPPPPPEPPKPPTEIVAEVPPPPPPPPTPPPVLTVDEIAELPEDFQNFLKRNPSVGSVHWSDDAIVIVPKKGKAERYILDENGIKQAEAKYGKLPAPPPPPPPPPLPPKAPRAPKQVQ